MGATWERIKQVFVGLRWLHSARAYVFYQLYHPCVALQMPNCAQTSCWEGSTQKWAMHADEDLGAQREPAMR